MCRVTSLAPRCSLLAEAERQREREHNDLWLSLSGYTTQTLTSAVPGDEKDDDEQPNRRIKSGVHSSMCSTILYKCTLSWMDIGRDMSRPREEESILYAHMDDGGDEKKNRMKIFWKIAGEACLNSTKMVTMRAHLLKLMP